MLFFLFSSPRLRYPWLLPFAFASLRRITLFSKSAEISFFFSSRHDDGEKKELFSSFGGSSSNIDIAGKIEETTREQQHFLLYFQSCLRYISYKENLRAEHKAFLASTSGARFFPQQKKRHNCASPKQLAIAAGVDRSPSFSGAGKRSRFPFCVGPSNYEGARYSKLQRGVDGSIFVLLYSFCRLGFSRSITSRRSTRLCVSAAVVYKRPLAYI